MVAVLSIFRFLCKQAVQVLTRVPEAKWLAMGLHASWQIFKDPVLWVVSVVSLNRRKSAWADFKPFLV